MSFDLDINEIIQYAYNIFASGTPIIFLFVGASFGVFVLGKLISLAKN